VAGTPDRMAPVHNGGGEVNDDRFFVGFVMFTFIVGFSASFFFVGAYWGQLKCDEICQSQSDMEVVSLSDVRHHIESDIPNWQSMDSFTLALAIRNWSTFHTAQGSPNRADVYEPVSWDGTLAEQLAAYERGQGVYCSGFSHTYEEVLDLFGYRSYGISAGDYPKYTHAAQLVQCEINGSHKFYIIDPYFECYFSWTNGTPISWLEMVNAVESGQVSTFHPVRDAPPDSKRASFTDAMMSPIYEENRVQLLGEDVPPRAIWAYEYSVRTNDGFFATRQSIRKFEEGMK
jgi:hypothetical protein